MTINTESTWPKGRKQSRFSRRQLLGMVGLVSAGAAGAVGVVARAVRLRPKTRRRTAGVSTASEVRLTAISKEQVAGFVSRIEQSYRKSSRVE